MVTARAQSSAHVVRVRPLRRETYWIVQGERNGIIKTLSFLSSQACVARLFVEQSSSVIVLGSIGHDLVESACGNSVITAVGSILRQKRDEGSRSVTLLFHHNTAWSHYCGSHRGGGDVTYTECEVNTG